MTRRGSGLAGKGFGARQVVIPPDFVPNRSILKPDDHEPFLALLNWIFEPHIGGFHSMTSEQRIQWMQRQMPQTYSRLAAGEHWSVLSDI